MTRSQAFIEHALLMGPKSTRSEKKKIKIHCHDSQMPAQEYLSSTLSWNSCEWSFSFKHIYRRSKTNVRQLEFLNMLYSQKKTVIKYGIWKWTLVYQLYLSKLLKRRACIWIFIFSPWCYNADFDSNTFLFLCYTFPVLLNIQITKKLVSVNNFVCHVGIAVCCLLLLTVSWGT